MAKFIIIRCIIKVISASRFMSKAIPLHWMAIKCIMRYLKGTLDLKLCLESKDIALTWFYNVDWVGDANDWRSTTVLGSCWYWIILWKCKKQPTIVLFVMEGEYMAISYCLKEAVWLRKLLANVGTCKKNQHSSYATIKDI